MIQVLQSRIRHPRFHRRLSSIWRRIFFPSFVFSLLACGGGSVGTGTGEGLTTIEGRLLTPEGNPLPGVTVELSDISAPDATSSSETNESGQFVIAVPSDSVPQTIQLDLTPAVSDATAPVATEPSAVAVTAPSTDPSGIVVQVIVDEEAPPVTIQSTNVKVQIVGNCAASFDNNRDITQITALADGTICTVRAEIQENGVPRDGARFQLESRACDETAPWLPVQTGVTVSDGISSAGTIDFPFVADQTNCLYRVVAPIDDLSAQQTSFEIFTIFKQVFDGTLAPQIPDPTAEPTPEPTPDNFEPPLEPTPEATPTPEVPA